MVSIQPWLLRCVLGLLVVFALQGNPAVAADWQYSGSVFLITTPDGANVPENTVLRNFPVLIRLSAEFFDFRQAQPEGADLRVFNAAGQALPLQVEEWDAERGVASVWVLVPEIVGNARQELLLRWGNPEAASLSDGRSVFGDVNDYLSVLHLDEPLQDSTGRLLAEDTGTSDTVGIVGRARRFPGGRGIFLGDQIEGFPKGAESHTTSAWIRPEAFNVRAVGWGNEQGQGKVILNFRSPAHIRMECYFSGADVAGTGPIRKGDWIHVMHTYKAGESLLYVNGQLDGVSRTDNAPLNIRTPARFWLGGWYNSYEYEGDIDEVRIARGVRTAEWARLEYDNQKPLQTLVGHLVRPGNTFSVSPSELSITEGSRQRVTATADGAMKVYWVMKPGNEETVVATDTLQYELEAGRVQGPQASMLEFRAVYADGVRSLQVPVTVHEELPEPQFRLTAPAAWDGRETLTLVPEITNLTDLQSKGVADLQVGWSTEGLAVISDSTSAGLKLLRAQNSGTLRVTATISNGGAPSTQTVSLTVREPASDPWEVRLAEADEKPVESQFFPRNDRNEGTLYYNGQVDADVPRVFLKLYADDVLVNAQDQAPNAEGRYAFTVSLKPGLIRYRTEFGVMQGAGEQVLERVGNLVCGDAFVIDGQSNAVSTDWGREGTEYSSEWIRSFGSMDGQTERGWGQAVRRDGGAWQIGYWGMELARSLVERQRVPICILNGAVGGTRVDQHQRNPQDPTDPKTIYGRLLNRIRLARLTHGIRAVFWHQGEADQGADGPDGGYGVETYERYFLSMAAGWKRDLPNVQHYYLFQIWPNACSQGGTRFSDRLRDVQRRLPRQFSHMSIMSTLGITPEGGCHYPAAGYARMAELMRPVVELHSYGQRAEQSVTAPDLLTIHQSPQQPNELVLEFDQPMAWNAATVSQFRLDGLQGRVVSGRVTGNQVRLQLTEGKPVSQVTWIVDRAWDAKALLYGTNGIAALTFCEVPVEQVGNGE
ncbi:MAG: hypothetical protein RLZZ232_2488 [Planctomycetota bacterium]